MKHSLIYFRTKLVIALVLRLAVGIPITLSAGYIKGSSNQIDVSLGNQSAARLQHVLEEIIETDNVSNAALFVEVGKPPASLQNIIRLICLQGGCWPST